MVVWVYAGGGEAEVNGLVPFLQRHMNCSFERRTPRPKPWPRPGVVHYHGLTGTSFAGEIRDDLRKYWDGKPGAILVVDDTDQNTNLTQHEAMLRLAVTDSLQASGIAGTIDALPIIVALAVPELEIWLLADWDNTFKKAFRNCHSAVQHELATQKGVNFSDPESFQVLNASGEYQKISQIIKDLIRLKCDKTMTYSKATDTPRLLQMINPAVVKDKCPYFREFWNAMVKLCP